MTLLLILFLGLCRGEILVDIAVVVPDSFNVSSFVNNMVQLSPPPTLNTTNNSTKNTTNYTATYAPFVLSGLSLNGINSIICVDSNCYNDNNVTRTGDSYTSGSISVDLIAGSVVGGVCGLILIIVGIIFAVRKTPKAKKSVIRVQVDLPTNGPRAHPLYKNRLQSPGRIIYVPLRTR